MQYNTSRVLKKYEEIVGTSVRVEGCNTTPQEYSRNTSSSLGINEEMKKKSSNRKFVISMFLRSVLGRDITFFDVEANHENIVFRISSDSILVPDAIGDKMGHTLSKKGEAAYAEAGKFAEEIRIRDQRERELRADDGDQRDETERPERRRDQRQQRDQLARPDGEMRRSNGMDVWGRDDRMILDETERQI
ncbi:hypothetical protein Syun_009335 [Stephania yunnanensis]|uniref:Uncharacterized protein n=1 Tax=Stephania yunnanensis TaxID=152371 RepID=A0AAP0KE85_9MAGN